MCGTCGVCAVCAETAVADKAAAEAVAEANAARRKLQDQRGGRAVEWRNRGRKLSARAAGSRKELLFAAEADKSHRGHASAAVSWGVHHDPHRSFQIYFHLEMSKEAMLEGGATLTTGAVVDEHGNPLDWDH